MKYVLIMLCTLAIITLAFIQTGVFQQSVFHIKEATREYLPQNIIKIELTYRLWDAKRPPPIKKTITDSSLIATIVNLINPLPEPPKVQNGFADFGQGADMICSTKDGKEIKITLEEAHRDISVDEGEVKYVRFDQYSKLWNLLCKEIGTKVQ